MEQGIRDQEAGLFASANANFRCAPTHPAATPIYILHQVHCTAADGGMISTAAEGAIAEATGHYRSVGSPDQALMAKWADACNNSEENPMLYWAPLPRHGLRLLSVTGDAVDDAVFLTYAPLRPLCTVAGVSSDTGCAGGQNSREEVGAGRGQHAPWSLELQVFRAFRHASAEGDVIGCPGPPTPRNLRRVSARALCAARRQLRGCPDSRTMTGTGPCECGTRCTGSTSPHSTPSTLSRSAFVHALSCWC
jgi:hypothetical protein